MYEVNGVKYDENNQKINTEQNWNMQEQPQMGTTRNKRMQENIAEEANKRFKEVKEMCY